MADFFFNKNVQAGQFFSQQREVPFNSGGCKAMGLRNIARSRITASMAVMPIVFTAVMAFFGVEPSATWGVLPA